MISYLFSALSLVFLVPILYFIPTGFSKKGNLIVVTVSFLLTCLGLLAYGSLGLWKTILILFIFIILLTYVLHNRMGFVLFEAAEETFEKNDQASTVQYHSYPVHTSIEKEETNDYLDVSPNDEIDEIEISDSLKKDASESYQEDKFISVQTALYDGTIDPLPEENEDFYLDDSLLLDREEEVADIYEKTNDRFVFDGIATSREND